MLGHLKTVLILVLGFVVFHTPVAARQALGVFFALLGVVSYTEIKRRQSLRGGSSGVSGAGGMQKHHSTAANKLLLPK